MDDLIWLDGFKYGLGVFVVKKGRKEYCGIINSDGNIVIAPEYAASYGRNTKLCIIDEQTALFRQSTNSYKFLNIADNKFYPISSSKCKDRLTTYKTGKGYGVSDIYGQEIVAHIYRSLYFADKYGEHLVACNKKNKYGIIASDGTTVLPFDYDAISYDPQVAMPGALPVKQGHTWFIVSTTTWQRVSEKGHNYICFSADGYMVFHMVQMRKEVCKHGIIDHNGNVLVPAKYDYLEPVGTGRWYYGDYKLNKYGAIDCRGEVKFSMSPNDMFIYDYYQGNYILSRYADNINPGGCGVVSENGRVIIPCIYNNVKRCDDVYIARGYGSRGDLMYTAEGALILPREYEWINMGDTLDYIAVETGGEWFYVNRQGERVLL